MATQQREGLAKADNNRHTKGEVPSETVVLRQFRGVNLSSPRDSVGDEDFWWLENLIPIGAGNLTAVPDAGAGIVSPSGETAAPTFSTDFQLGSVPYVFAIFPNGNAWVGPSQTATGWTKIATAKFTSGKTAATPWSNQGILIVDPVAGYYDWNVTAANTLTNLSGQVINPVMNTSLPGSPYVVRVIDTGGSGSGASIGYSFTAISVQINGASTGSGYAVGDVIFANGGTLTTSTAAPLAQQNQPTAITVTTVSGSGAITAISVQNAGFYYIRPSSPNVATGGSGTGASILLVYGPTSPYIISPGSGYVTPQVQYFLGSWFNTNFITLGTSGTVFGTAIATYVGRAWIAINRTVQFTDANSYSQFGNSGSAFTINDSYLINQITALYAANNYLYIFGDTSVDVLSNVAVNSTGTVTFSRLNASASIGLSADFQNSVIAYERAIAFANPNGFYLMSGATPQKISEELDPLFSAMDFTYPVYGMQVTIANTLCLAFLFSLVDTFVSSGTERSLMAVRYKNRWHFVSQHYAAAALRVTSTASSPVGGVQRIWGWAGNTLYPLLSATSAYTWLLKTKLWDGGEPIDDKSGINVGIGAVFTGAGLSDITLTVDNENGSQATTIYSQGVGVQYELLTAPALIGGGKYVGITAQGSSNVSQVRMLALEFKNMRRW